MSSLPNDIDEKEEIIPGFSDINSFTQQALRNVLQATKVSNDLPACGDDFDFYSSYQGVRDVLDIEGKRILHIIQNVLRHHNVKGNLTSNTDATDLDDKFDVLMDANDQILEKVGTYLDEAAGLKKKEDPLIVATATPKQYTTASWNKKGSGNTPSISGYRLLTARNILRPQLKFKDKIDNGSNPFLPHITKKPNALKSLEESLKFPEGVTADEIDNVDFVFPHPYQYELSVLKPTQKQLTAVDISMPRPIEETAFTFVSNPDQLSVLMKKLAAADVIAVDLEHHSYRSFQGITCLMQISIENEDFLIDTLELRSDLSPLNQVFTDSTKTKVFHGADSDIAWLQRDLGLYIVNMFDTCQAARVLNHARFSLAYLLQQYCDVTTDKQYQLADWRIRPLPDELIKYARNDTHYLLYIYEKMKSELLERGNVQKNLLKSVLQRSTDICSYVYRKPVFRKEDYLELYKKSKKIFNSQQLQALEKLYSWRDQLARVEDESTGYVLPNHMLLQIAEVLPRERQGVFACCNPIPPLVRQFLPEIHGFILEAREAPLTKVKLPQQKRPTSFQHPKYNPASVLNCPHDLTHQSKENSPDLPTIPDVSVVTDCSSLFGTNNSGRIITLKSKPLLSVFGEKGPAVATSGLRIAAALAASFTSPFTMFLPDEDNMDSSPCLESWRLKKNTAKRKNRSPSPQPGPSPKKLKIDENKSQTESLSVKEMKVQQKKTDEHMNLLPQNDGKPKKKKKKEQKRQKQVDAEFAAFDYSQTDAKMFLGSGSKKGQKAFDPNAEQSGNDHQKVSKPSQFFPKSQKSFSYSKNRDTGGAQQKWPKSK